MVVVKRIYTVFGETIRII